MIDSKVKQSVTVTPTHANMHEWLKMSNLIMTCANTHEPIDAILYMDGLDIGGGPIR